MVRRRPIRPIRPIRHGCPIAGRWTKAAAASLLALTLLAAAPPAADAGRYRAPERPPADIPTKVPLAERVALLQESYPELIYSVTNNTLRLMSNRNLVISGGGGKTYHQMRESADLGDQLAQIYPLGKCFKGRLRNLDPGQMRNEALFRAAYGDNAHQVRTTTDEIDWFGTPIRFSNRHGAADALRAVLAELSALPAEMQAALKQPERAFEWSTVAGSDRLDVHSFGIAIRLNPEYGVHWRFSNGRVRGYNNRVDPQIIAIFERHGFIWGGKWYHFTTHHFEYRPEMIAIGKRALERGCDDATK